MLMLMLVGKEVKKKGNDLNNSNHASLKVAEYHKQHRHRKSGGHFPASSSAGFFRSEAAGLSWFLAVFAAIIRGCRFLGLERTRKR